MRSRKGSEKEKAVTQIFPIKMTVEEYLGKDKKLYATFMNLEEAYDIANQEALWNILKIYAVGGQLLEGIEAFHRESSACEGGRGTQRKLCYRRGSETEEYNVTVVVYCFYGWLYDENYSKSDRYSCKTS